MTESDYIVPAGSPPQRLDVFLTHAFPRGSRQRVRALIEADAVRVNGRRRPKGAMLQAGDVVRVTADSAPARLAANDSLRVAVLHEDADVIVVDKPAGMPSHAVRPDDNNTVANFLLARYPELRAVGSDPREPGLVHRLDTGTSGVLVVAHRDPAYAALRQQFAARTVIKEYVAMVSGDVTAAGEVRMPLAHDRRNPRRMRACRSDDEAAARRARPATTRYRPIERFGSETLLAIEIPTGVTHQIRVHLAEIGHPIVGDRLYGSRDPVRQLLHARRITFTHPRSGERLTIESPLPTDLQAHLENLRSDTAPHGGRRRAR
ncbi:MAG TPA: RluA family pseudouridine synthase [Candidatus Kryptonia bacterium]|nr:RluA family pseudouridine synthase [Candidatus Kryptonia bacterium]